jgi:hypothetical protein
MVISEIASSVLLKNNKKYVYQVSAMQTEKFSISMSLA